MSNIFQKIRESAESLTEPEKQELAIALTTLRMPGARGTGSHGPSKKEAAETVDRLLAKKIRSMRAQVNTVEEDCEDCPDDDEMLEWGHRMNWKKYWADKKAGGWKSKADLEKEKSEKSEAVTPETAVTPRTCEKCQGKLPVDASTSVFVCPLGWGCAAKNESGKSDEEEVITDAPDDVKRTAVELIAKYNEYGNTLRRANTLRQVSERLSKVAQMAEALLLHESEDWFDAHTVKRDMKDIKKYGDDFSKFANEADKLHERLVALYDDMGHKIQRYVDILDSDDDSMQNEQLAEWKVCPECGSHTPDTGNCPFCSHMDEAAVPTKATQFSGIKTKYRWPEKLSHDEFVIAQKTLNSWCMQGGGPPPTEKNVMFFNPDMVVKALEKNITKIPAEARPAVDKFLARMKGTTEQLESVITEGFKCQECGKKFKSPREECSKCGGSDIDIDPDALTEARDETDVQVKKPMPRSWDSTPINWEWRIHSPGSYWKVYVWGDHPEQWGARARTGEADRFSSQETAMKFADWSNPDKKPGSYVRGNFAKANESIIQEAMHPKFEAAAEKFRATAEKKIQEYEKKHFPNLEVSKLSFAKGTRYWKVVKSGLGGSSRTVYTFLETSTGDIFKPATWKAAAKHSRGNIFASDGGMSAVGVYGTQYLKGMNIGTFESVNEAAFDKTAKDLFSNKVVTNPEIVVHFGGQVWGSNQSSPNAILAGLAFQHGISQATLKDWVAKNKNEPVTFKFIKSGAQKHATVGQLARISRVA